VAENTQTERISETTDLITDTF